MIDAFFLWLILHQTLSDVVTYNFCSQRRGCVVQRAGVDLHSEKWKGRSQQDGFVHEKV